MNGWDLVIYIFLALDVFAISLLLVKKTPFKNSALRELLTFLLALSGCVVFYGSFIEPRIIKVNDYSIELKNEWTEHNQFVVVSDLHVGSYKQANFVSDIASTIEEINPDAVLLLGDFVYEGDQHIEYLNPLESVASRFPTYAVLGNHDYDLSSNVSTIDEELGKAIEQKLSDLGIIVLKNSGQRFDDSHIWLGGIDDLWTDRADIENALEGSENTDIKILLSHNPDVILKAPDVDLVLSGHTHGGQIRLPWLGPIPPLPTILNRQYGKGIFAFENTQLFITSGAGESGPRARLLTPPEIAAVSIFY